MACNWLMMTSSGDDKRPSGSLGLLTDKTKKNKTFNKRKNRALLTFRRLQKHYEIFSNNVLRKKHYPETVQSQPRSQGLSSYGSPRSPQGAVR